MGRLVMVDITIHNPLRLSSAMSLALRLLSLGVHEKLRDCSCPLSVILILLSSSNQRYTSLFLSHQFSFSSLKICYFISVAISSSGRRSPRAWLYDTFIRSWGIMLFTFQTVYDNFIAFKSDKGGVNVRLLDKAMILHLLDGELSLPLWNKLV